MIGTAAPCGTRTAYSAGCRCQPCRDANAAYVRAWRAGKGAGKDAEYRRTARRRGRSWPNNKGRAS